MCHGQALNLEPLTVETCPACQERDQLFRVRFKLQGEAVTLRACRSCILAITRTIRVEKAEDDQ